MSVSVKRFLKSHVIGRVPLFLCWMSLATLPMSAGAQDDLSRFHDKNRLLLIFAPSVSNTQWRHQNALLSQSEAPFQERELLRFDILEHGESRGPDGKLDPRAAVALHVRFGVKPGRFRVLLIGKDGHVAFSEPIPVSLRDLTGRIDRMPMRREEMRLRHGSGAAP